MRNATTDERRRLADWLEGLDEVALSTPSLCTGWTVREVAAHLAVAMSGSIPGFLVQVLRHRMNAHRANEVLAQERAKRPWPEIVATIRDRADQRLTNPGTGPAGPLADVLVHTGDMRLPLALPHEPPAERVTAVLEFLTGTRAVGFVPKGRLDGLRLVATDLPFAAGDGAEISGRAADLMMAAAGRPAVLPALTGSGVDLLAERLRPGIA